MFLFPFLCYGAYSVASLYCLAVALDLEDRRVLVVPDEVVDCWDSEAEVIKCVLSVRFDFVASCFFISPVCYGHPGVVLVLPVLFISSPFSLVFCVPPSEKRFGWVNVSRGVSAFEGEECVFFHVLWGWVVGFLCWVSSLVLGSPSRLAFVC